MTVDAHNHPMIQAMREHVNAGRYDGGYTYSCLVGQLSLFLDYRTDGEETPAQFLATRYNLPFACLYVIYGMAGDTAFRLNLEAALWMAERVVAHFLDDPASTAASAEDAVVREYDHSRWAAS